MKLFGLIGYPLSHSYSREYFLDKFRKEKIPDCDYQLFELNQILDILLNLYRIIPIYWT